MGLRGDTARTWRTSASARPKSSVDVSVIRASARSARMLANRLLASTEAGSRDNARSNMSDQSLTAASLPSSATATPAHPAPASPAAARTKLLLEGPILPTLLRLAAPNILTLLAFAGVITFDGFFLGRI